MRGELKELETWFVDHGHLSKDWRDQFKQARALKGGVYCGKT